MKESPSSPYANLVFRETFNSEQSVRKNGGTGFTGRKHSEDSKLKISKSLSGRKYTNRNNKPFRIDLTGESFGDLIVIEYSGKTQSGVNKWLCRCVCGKETSVRSCDLRSGKTKSCGCLRSRQEPRVDLTGKIFDRLTVIDFSHKDNGRIFWNCLCECGNTSVCATATLNSGGSTQCYKCGRKFSEPGNSGMNVLYKDYKHGAKKRGYEFNLSKDDFKELTSQSCEYCGSEPSYRINTNTTDNYGDYIYNGIDRVDNTKGYELGNCVTCCKLCNQMKMDLSLEEFKNHIIKINNIINGEHNE